MAEPKPGDLLIAEPFMGDPHFDRSVVLLTEHDDQQGSVGFVLNRPTQHTLGELLETELSVTIPVYEGGPVQQNTLHFIHRAPQMIQGGVEVTNDIFWSGDFEQLRLYLQTEYINPGDFRFFLGYSGWGVNQLQSEIEENAWFLTQADQQTVFTTDSEAFWSAILQKMGGKYRFMANAPRNPRFN
jgi:putative transcriptional regulator